MERIAQIAGTQDPNAIFAMLNETEIEQLRLRHEQSEQLVKDQLTKLQSVGIEISQTLLSNGVKLGSAEINQHDSEAVLCSKQKALDSMAQFVDSLYVAILDLSNKVHMIKEGYQFLGITYLFTEDHKKMENGIYGVKIGSTNKTRNSVTLDDVNISMFCNN
jgi:hypothetical protein